MQYKLQCATKKVATCLFAKKWGGHFFVAHCILTVKNIRKKHLKLVLRVTIFPSGFQDSQIDFPFKTVLQLWWFTAATVGLLQLRVVYSPRIDQRLRIHLNVAIYLQHFSIKKAFFPFCTCRLRLRLIGRFARFVSFLKRNVIDISSYISSYEIFQKIKFNKLQC